jgi:hypothetical protein
MPDAAPHRLHTSVAATGDRSTARPARRMGDLCRQVSWLAAQASLSSLPGASTRRASGVLGEDSPLTVAGAAAALRPALPMPRIGEWPRTAFPFHRRGFERAAARPSRAGSKQDACAAVKSNPQRKRAFASRADNAATLPAGVPRTGRSVGKRKRYRHGAEHRVAPPCACGEIITISDDGACTALCGEAPPRADRGPGSPAGSGPCRSPGSAAIATRRRAIDLRMHGQMLRSRSSRSRKCPGDRAARRWSGQRARRAAFTLITSAGTMFLSHLGHRCAG